MPFWRELSLSIPIYGEAYLPTSARAATRQQLIIDMCDVWIPATGAGILTVNEGALGILGCVYAFSPIWKRS